MRAPLMISSAIFGLVVTGCCSTTPRAETRPVTMMPAAWQLEVTSVDVDLRDEERGRDVPVRLYHPSTAGDSLPIVFISHGIGESRESYEWLGRAIAAEGYLVVHPTHRGTDRARLEEGWLALYRATQDADNWRNRVLDISYLLDEHTTLASRLPESLTIDPERVAVVGHSAGAWTAAAIGGLDLASGESLHDPRVDAVAPLSMPKTGSIDGPEAWASLELPALHMTGTCDRQIIWWTFAGDRRIPWEFGTAPNQYLLTLPGGTHTTFSNSWDPVDAKQSRLQELTALAVAEFLDAWLRGQPEPDFARLAEQGVRVERR